MSNTITTKSTSKSSATGQDIELRATSNTRLIFRPEVVDNPHDSRASVRGTFIFQKKKGHSKWEDYPSFKLSQVREGEHIKFLGDSTGLFLPSDFIQGQSLRRR
jgi:hypothetical protein